ncbi:hypothetical protein L2E82_18009 [Cichorium intybus]|uniref:Uncharacterized protein n=1 Tax=Cichorium intybus TaxID=13427 RepID=A0ACB9F8P8_CICIN|nr:hypothetical protein L2E82_18009 [Cichorium intybus]
MYVVVWVYDVFVFLVFKKLLPCNLLIFRCLRFLSRRNIYPRQKWGRLFFLLLLDFVNCQRVTSESNIN